MWYIYTMEHYSAIENKDIMKFVGKWVKLDKVILNEVTHTKKEKKKHGMYSHRNGY